MQTCRRLLILAFFLLVGTRACDAAWTTYQGDAAHSGYVPIELNPTLMRPVWSHTYASHFNTRVLRPVAAGDGQVYLSISQYYKAPGELHAFDALSGTEQWSSLFPDTGGITAPAYHDHSVYITTERPDQILFAYQAPTGGQKFQPLELNESWAQNAPTYFGGLLYQGGNRGVHAIDATTGASVWDADIGSFGGWSPAVNEAECFVYVGGNSSNPGQLRVFNRLTGQLNYSIPDPQSKSNASTSVLLGTLNDAYSFDNDRLIRFDLGSRSISWTVPGGFHDGLAVAHGQLFMINNGVLEVRDELTGSLLWNWNAPVGAKIFSNLVVTDSYVLVGGSLATYAIDLNSHQVAWKASGEAHSLSMADNRLYVVSPAPNGFETASLTAYTLGVPEPSTLVLSVLGAGLIGCVGWRRRFAQSRSRQST